MRRAARWETHKNNSSTASSVSPVSRVVRWIDWRMGCSEASSSTVAGGSAWGMAAHTSR